MNTYEFFDAKSVVVCGDIHGKFDELVYRITTLYGMTDTVVIVAGDCGFGFHRRGYYDTVYERLQPKLEKANCRVVFVRGNHDNPAYFDGEVVNKKRWIAVPDYSFVSACGKRILCVGGATSVDRYNRESYKPVFDQNGNEGPRKRIGISHIDKMTNFDPADWWPYETPYYDESILSSVDRTGRTFDTVVSHIPPSMCEDVTPPTWLSYLVENDPTLTDDMKRDRETMDALLHYLRWYCHPIRNWLYGHYHHSWNAEIDGIHYTMLKTMEMKELR